MKGLSGAKAACIKPDTGDAHSPTHEWHMMQVGYLKGGINAAVRASTITKQKVAAGSA